MERLILVLILILVFFRELNGRELSSPNAIINSEEQKGYLPLRVMTFNIWRSGTQVQNGLYKVAKHVRIVDPDIVALQVNVTNFANCQMHWVTDTDIVVL